MEKMGPQSIVTDPPQPSPSTPSPSEPSPQTSNKTEEETEEVKEASKGTFSNESVHMICPHCHADIHTLVVEVKRKRVNVPEWVCLSMTLICAACCIAVILIPYTGFNPCTGSSSVFCPDNCPDDVKKEHYCPECDSYLGK